MIAACFTEGCIIRDVLAAVLAFLAGISLYYGVVHRRQLGDALIGFGFTGSSAILAEAVLKTPEVRTDWRTYSFTLFSMVAGVGFVIAMQEHKHGTKK